MANSGSLRDRVRKNARESASKGVRYITAPEGVSFVKVESDGRMKFNILPYTVTSDHHPDGVEAGEFWYKRPFLLHRNVGVENNSVVCPRSIGKKCPICEYQAKLYSEGETDKDTLKKLRPQDRVIYAVEIISGQKEKGLHLLEISKYAFQSKLDGELNDPEGDEFLGFADAEGGYLLSVRFKEESFNKISYAVAERIDFIARDEEPSKKVLKSVPQLDDCLNILSYNEIKKLFFEVGNDNDDDDEEKPKSRKAKAQVDDDDDNEKPARKSKQAEPEEDEPEEDEKPARKSKRAEPEEDEPEEDEPEEDEPEEDEKPARKSKRAEPEEDEPEEDEKPARKSKQAEPEEDEPEEDEKPSRKRGRPSKGDDAEMKRGKKPTDNDEKKPSARKPGEGRCPYGHDWGDAKSKKTLHDDCDDCPVWKSCKS